MIFLKEFSKKFDFVKNQQTAKSRQNYPVGKELSENLYRLEIDIIRFLVQYCASPAKDIKKYFAI